MPLATGFGDPDDDDSGDNDDAGPQPRPLTAAERRLLEAAARMVRSSGVTEALSRAYLNSLAQVQARFAKPLTLSYSRQLDEFSRTIARNLSGLSGESTSDFAKSIARVLSAPTLVGAAAELARRLGEDLDQSD